MAEKTCSRCGASFQGRGGARYCTPACRAHARSSREKTRILREMREIGELVYLAKTRIEAGDSDTRRQLRATLQKRGVDLDDYLTNSDDLTADMLDRAEAHELAAWQCVDDFRRIIESNAGTHQNER